MPQAETISVNSTSANPAFTNAFSVDVEDYFHVQAFADRIDPQAWHTYPSRVVANTQRVLRLLDKYHVRATFYILGWVAERFPHLVREIQQAGHEIGCHSYWHRLIYRMTPDEFREDLRQATAVISEITGQQVIAYRAPSFSVTAQSLWALDILIEEGYQFDSSIFPVHHDTYGIPHAKTCPHVIERPAGTICEFPPAVRHKGFINFPVAGGGYFRMLPLRLTLHWLRNINRKEGRPFAFYIHPWELDPGQPRLATTRKSSFRHYQNLHRTEAKLNRLLESFNFTTISDAWPNNATTPLPALDCPLPTEN